MIYHYHFSATYGPWLRLGLYDGITSRNAPIWAGNELALLREEVAGIVGVDAHNVTILSISEVGQESVS